MKFVYLFFLLAIFVLLSTAGYAHMPGDTTFVYSYDNSGNRTERVIDLTKSAQVAYEASSSVEQQEISAELEDLDVKIYPNPTKGMLKVKVSGADAYTASLAIYNPQGKLIIEQVINKSINQVNLSNQPPGLYILKIIVGQNVSDWKIIKD